MDPYLAALVSIVSSNLSSDTPEQQELLDRARDGDPEAFDALFKAYRHTLQLFVRRRLDPKLRGRVDVSDVVQETQLEAYRRLDGFLNRRPMPFGLWLQRTAYERLIMLRRRHLGAARRAAGREAPLPDRSSMLLARRLLDGQLTPSQQFDRRERAERIRGVVARLSESDREILFLRSFEDRSYDEIAHLLDIDSAAARKRHGRALLRLHSLLEEEGFTGSTNR